MGKSLGMSSPYILRKSTIEKVITEVKPGNYAFGNIRKKDGRDTFYPKYIGRSDTDLKQEIINQGINNMIDPKTKLPVFDCFKFVYSKNADEAYKKECIDYHAFKKQLTNQIHPAIPKNSKVKCPVEVCEYSK